MSLCLVGKNWDTGVNFWISLNCRFTNVLVGLAPNDMVQRTARRLDTLHSEGVHVCKFLVSLQPFFLIKETSFFFLGVMN